MNRFHRPAAARIVTTAILALALFACHGKSADSYISAGDAAVQAQKFDEAEGDYKQAIDLAPNDPHPHVALGNLYLQEHKPMPAQAEFMRVLELDPKNAPAHVALGNMYSDQAQYAMAESQYRAALALDPSQSEYHADLGTALAKESRPAEAQTELRTAIGFDPKNAQAHYQLGNLLATMPDHATEAKAEYDQAHQLDPKLVPPEVATPPVVTVSGAPPAPGAPPVVTATEAPATAPVSTAKVRAVTPARLFLLTHDSSVYTNPDNTSATVGNVRHRKYVRVIGIAGNDWLQIRLKNGTVGFIPTSAAQ